MEQDYHNRYQRFVSCLFLLFYLTGFQQDGSSWSCSRFLPAEREFVLAAVLTRGFLLWASASVKHLEMCFLVKGAI